MNKISIVIPVINEEATIVKLLKHLIDNSSSDNIAEIMVVDGGSTDKTIEIVSSFVTSSEFSIKSRFSVTTRTDIKVLHSKKGRAKQMNTGAEVATGNILYFLHADAFPPKDFDQLILNEVAKENLAGCFRMQFDSNHWWLRLASWFTQFSWRPCRGGDQSQFITKDLFEAIGGYDEDYIIYEDNILINELYKRKQFVVINKKIKTSARLYKKLGVWKLQYHFLRIYIMRWFGASADDIYSYFKKHIP